MPQPFDVVGYTADADTYCPLCASTIYGDGLSIKSDTTDREGNLVGPIFVDSEWDYIVHCGKCGVAIDTKLTSDGLAYEANNF